jgi:hypothetical protein
LSGHSSMSQGASKDVAPGGLPIVVARSFLLVLEGDVAGQVRLSQVGEVAMVGEEEHLGLAREVGESMQGGRGAAVIEPQEDVVDDAMRHPAMRRTPLRTRWPRLTPERGHALLARPNHREDTRLHGGRESYPSLGDEGKITIGGQMVGNRRMAAS